MCIRDRFNNISKFFGSVIALKDVTMKVKKGEIMCLLGDNGAGKSTLIKTLSGVHKPNEGEIIVEGNKTEFDSPRDALDMGIATVYQDLALVSLMSVTRNFFMGREPKKGFGPLKTFDIEKAQKIVYDEDLNVQLADSGYAFHINSKGVNKGTGFLEALKMLDANLDDCVAIGDSETDIPLFEIIKNSIAVSNSTEKQ